ncbi:MAG: hypothetical protein CM15mV41_0120 [Caudoviricetes sp.]|nr:MAG: hypothetical protein CM15mV41_0120 [Caudoviricetes sp.]
MARSGRSGAISITFGRFNPLLWAREALAKVAQEAKIQWRRV